MPQAVDVRTPVATGAATKVGKGLWRKQVLPVGEFRVGGRKLSFTPDYHQAVAKAFADAAYDTVPTMLADKTNDHTMAVLDEGGEVLALEAEPDGLYATVKLSQAANEKVENNPRLGVSVRIRENYDRSDGKFWPAAMQHLLLTWDPRIAGMKPWEPIDLSNGGDDVLVIDLSTATYEATTTSEGDPMATLTPEELAQLRAALPLLQRLQEDNQPAGEPDPTEEGEELDDEEFERLAAEIFGDLDDEDTDSDPGSSDDDQDTDQGDGDGGDPAGQDDPAPVPADVAASNAGGDYLQLANASREDDRATILDLSNRLNAAEYERERDAISRTIGLPPSIIDLARPLLEGSRHVVELSNGTDVDAGEIVRKVLHEVGRQVQLLDLSEPLGTAEPTDEEQAAAERRRAVADEVMAIIH